MKILLLQDHIYLPSYGGGVKANRMLLEGLARRGHKCAAITPAFAPSAGPANDDEFREEMERRGLAVCARVPNVSSYRFRGVDVDALHAPSPESMREHVERRTRELNPDWVLVTSWNEWMETTQVAPSEQSGWRALNQTATWAGRFQA